MKGQINNKANEIEAQKHEHMKKKLNKRNKIRASRLVYAYA